MSEAPESTDDLVVVAEITTTFTSDLVRQYYETGSWLKQGALEFESMARGYAQMDQGRRRSGAALKKAQACHIASMIFLTFSERAGASIAAEIAKRKGKGNGKGEGGEEEGKQLDGVAKLPD